MITTPKPLANVRPLTANLAELVNLAGIPPLLDVGGVNKYLAPVGRTLLYSLATSGEIQTASIGLKRGRRVFVTRSVVDWLQRRMEATERPNMGSGKQSARKRSARKTGTTDATPPDPQDRITGEPSTVPSSPPA